MVIFKILSLLLSYPEEDLKSAIPELKQALVSHSRESGILAELFDYIIHNDLITLQENYTKTFDRNANCSLHLFEHIYGEDRSRGQAMIDLLEEYQSHNVSIAVSDLPDYLPIFLEYLFINNDKQYSLSLLGNAIDVINHIGKELKVQKSIYAGILDVLIQLSPTKPTSLKDKAIHIMDETMQAMGPTNDGSEVLVNFCEFNYPRI